MTTPFAETLSDLELAPPASRGGLSMLPLVGPTPKSVTPAYDLAADALARGTLVVTEVSEAGSVQELLVRNSGTRPVMLVDGEQLVGAKQNRVLNISILVPAGVSLIVPVSCVEAGRWARNERGFASSRDMHFASGRRHRMARVQESAASHGSLRGDQAAVWNDVDALMCALEVRSETAAMSDALSAVAGRVDGYNEGLPPVRNQRGAVFADGGVAVGGVAVGVELVDHPSAWAAIHDKVVRSYAVEALRSPRTDEIVDIEVARAWLRDLAQAQWLPQPSVGLGDTVRLAHGATVGAALVWEDRLVHASLMGEIPAE